MAAAECSAETTMTWVAVATLFGSFYFFPAAAEKTTDVDGSKPTRKEEAYGLLLFLIV